jgi:hypothetical protein
MKKLTHTDSIGNKIKEGDGVFVLLPKYTSTYRKAVVKAFRNESTEGKKKICEVLVEYKDNHMYRNVQTREVQVHMEGPIRGATYESAHINEWRSNTDIIKFDQKYFE